MQPTGCTLPWKFMVNPFKDLFVLFLKRWMTAAITACLPAKASMNILTSI
jgi:hypothetical protein